MNGVFLYSTHSWIGVQVGNLQMALNSQFCKSCDNIHSDAFVMTVSTLRKQRIVHCTAGIPHKSLRQFLVIAKKWSWLRENQGTTIFCLPLPVFPLSRRD